MRVFLIIESTYNESGIERAKDLKTLSYWMDHIKNKQVHNFYSFDPRHTVMDADIRDDMPPIGVGIIWAIGKLTGLIVSKEWMAEMKSGEHGVLMVILIAKFFILFLDIALYILPSLMYITTCYNKHKDELKYLFFSILVLSPITWCYDYTHIDWSCVRAGFYMLSLIMLHTQEFEMSVCFTSFMINVDHKSFYYILP